MTRADAAPFPIRDVPAEQAEQFSRSVERAFNIEPHAEDLALWTRYHTEADGRYFAAYDGERIVGTTGHAPMQMTVPWDGEPRVVEAAGVTAVSTSALHRRRGVLSSLMRHQLDALHDAGTAVAVLTASESGIYGRFGYGVAALTTRLRVDTRHARFLTEPGFDGRLRWGSVKADRDALAAVHAHVVRRRPGGMARPTSLRWDTALHDSEHRREGATPLRVVVAEGAGGPEGYALFRTKEGRWEADLPDDELTVVELVATTPACNAALWRAVLDVDLVRRVDAFRRPPDDPLAHLLAEPRQLVRTASEELWVRLVDLPAALAARSYAVEAELTLRVHDAFCRWNDGTWRLRLSPKGAEVERERGRAGGADLECTSTDLGAAYLGGTTLAVLAEAGRVVEHRPGALVAASRAFRGDVEPWCFEHF